MKKLFFLILSLCLTVVSSCSANGAENGSTSPATSTGTTPVVSVSETIPAGPTASTYSKSETATYYTEQPYTKSPPSGEIIQWADPSFEEIMRLALDKPEGDITEGELDFILSLEILANWPVGTEQVPDSDYTVFLNGYYYGGRNREAYASLRSIDPHKPITRLDDIVHFKNLDDLFINYSKIEDLSPLADMPKLSSVTVSNALVKDISPISGLSRLAKLSIAGNKITDISPIGRLTSLTGLSIGGNGITDISVLAGLTDLEYLSLDNLRITDFSPLKNKGAVAKL